jgi:cell division inhibitor SulA
VLAALVSSTHVESQWPSAAAAADCWSTMLAAIVSSKLWKANIPMLLLLLLLPTAGQPFLQHL